MNSHPKIPSAAILSRLTTECFFKEIFDDVDLMKEINRDQPKKMVGYFRADYNGCRWWNTIWYHHKELATEAVSKEADSYYAALTAKDALADLAALRKFCESHPEACVDQQYHQEYDFYLEGEVCNYWIRLITREKDYNMYFHAYVKEFSPEHYFPYLEELRESGVTNMFGAVPYLQDEFPDLRCDRERAKAILTAWMKSFEKAGGYE